MIETSLSRPLPATCRVVLTLAVLALPAWPGVPAASTVDAAVEAWAAALVDPPLGRSGDRDAIVADWIARLAADPGHPLAEATLVLGSAGLFAPFKGGTLVPTPDVLLPGIVLDGTGGFVAPFAWPAGVPSGL